MDSLTQIVLGASVGEAVLGKKVGNKALVYGALAGTIPDLDIFIGGFSDTVSAIEFHRGFSHSIVFALLASPLLGWLAAKFHAEATWKDWALLFFLGFITHSLLDIFTTWGTQFFWPLDYRIALNSIFVIDPMYTLPFLCTTTAVLFYKRNSKTRRFINVAGLFWSSSYLVLTLFIKTVVEERFTAALDEQNIAYEQMSTRPSAFHTILWNANVDTEDAYLLGEYSFFDTQPIRFTRYPKNREQFAAVEKEDMVKRLIVISKGWYLVSEEQGQLYFNDLRFGVRPKPDGTKEFVFKYALTPSPEGLQVEETPKSAEDGRFLMNVLWQRIQGN